MAGSLNEIKQPARLTDSSGPSGSGKMRLGGARTGKLMGRLLRPQELAVSVLAHRRGNNGDKRSKTPPSTKGLRPRTDREFTEARNISQLIPSSLAELKEDVSLFRGGRLQQFLENWKLITSDSEILQTVTGLCLDFDCRQSP